MASIPLKKFVGIITGIALIFPLTSGIKLPLPANLLLLQFSLLVASIPQSVWPGGSFDVVLVGFSKLVMVILAAALTLADPRRLRNTVRLHALIITLLSLVAMRGDARNGRMSGAGNMFSDPNDFALNAVIALPFAIVFCQTADGWLKRAGWAVATIVLIVMVVMTGSRGGFVALSVCGLLVLFRLVKRKLIAAAIVVFAVCVMAALPVYRARLASIADPQKDTVGSAQARQELLRRSVTVSLRRPLLGIGPGQFQLASGAWHETHNTYMQLAAECGIPVLAIFLLMVRRSLGAVRLAAETSAERSDDRQLSWGIYISLCSYLAGALFLSTAYWLAPYLLIVYAWSAGQLSHQTRPVNADALPVASTVGA